MAWIVPIPPSPRHPKPRWQVRYQDGSRERSAGIFNSPKAAETVRKRIDRGLPPTLEVLATDSVDATKAQTLIGDYITNTWWPTWRAQHPDSATASASASRSGSSPPSGTSPSPPWTPTGSAPGRPAWSPRDSSPPPSTPTSACSAPSSTPPSTATTSPTPRSCARATPAGSPRPRTCPWTAARSGSPVGSSMPSPKRSTRGIGRWSAWPRWPGCAGESWPRCDGRTCVWIIHWMTAPSPALAGCGSCERSATPAAAATAASKARRPKLGGAPSRSTPTPAKRSASITTSSETRRPGWCSLPRAARGKGGTLAANNFRRVWMRALKRAGLDGRWPEYGGLHFHDLRHSHATWLLALRVPMIAVSNRLGHANPVITMMVYAHVDRQVERGLLTAEDLGLTAPDDSEPKGRSA